MMINSTGKNLKSFEISPIIKTRFSVTYKDQDDLYRLFKEKLKELGIPPESVYNLDYDGTHEEINDAERLSELADNHGEVQVYVRDCNEYVNSFEDSTDDPHRESCHKGKTSERSHCHNERFDNSDRSRRSPSFDGWRFCLFAS
ncbi:hypothetical protein KIN20_014029 [Parelaphostrongylus tenuis]|uniref:Uncharacterized protein n=1 Tax=Parelaphostrongylus tenuis TaxID=148309 RepID=A0AAD5MWV7_PARTN|nr:hypothetical protein KIN20_014029 [Parelaphostrongylus tenuis]